MAKIFNATERPFSVSVDYSSGRSVTVARYHNAELARRDAVRFRTSYPRARSISAFGPGGLLLKLNRRPV